MNPVASFPELFGHGRDPDPEAWPFVVGRGWEPVLLLACRELRGIAEREGLPVHVVEVRERDGALRIELSRRSARLLVVQVAATLLSRRTCQRCAALSDRMIGGEGRGLPFCATCQNGPARVACERS